MVEQDVEHAEQGQFSAAARPSSSGECPANLAGEWPGVVLESGYIKKALNLPVNVAEPHWRPDYDPSSGQHFFPLHVFYCAHQRGGAGFLNTLLDGLYHGAGPTVLGRVDN